MSNNERTADETRQVFDKYLITTSLPMPDIHQVNLLPSREVKVQNTEEQLVMYNRKLDKGAVMVLIDYILFSHPFLTKLHLNNNRVGPEGAALLASLLDRDKTNLQELFLNRNFLYDEGVSAIAKSMETNTRLKQLKIAMNGAEDAGARAIATMMEKNNTLRGLEFDQNKYTTTGLALLADSLNKNNGLKVVQVGEASKIKSRLQFVRMMIQTENPDRPRTGSVLCFSKDKNNDVIDLLLEEWRLCKQEGKELITLPTEKIERFSRFNKLNETEMQEMYEDIKSILKKAREEGVEDLRQAKILLMGRARAGKTSLMRSVIAGRSLLTGDGPDRATVSVDTMRWTVAQAKCTFWDFGGQEEYYMTHSFFVTRRCVVLICVNLTEYEDTDASFQHHVQYFVDSIQSHAPGAKFIIVGTHADKLDGEGASLRKSLVRRFEANEALQKQRILKAICKLDPKEAAGDKSFTPEEPIDTSNIVRNRGGNRKPERVIKSHRLTGTKKLDELEIEMDSSKWGDTSRGVKQYDSLRSAVSESDDENEVQRQWKLNMKKKVQPTFRESTNNNASGFIGNVTRGQAVVVDDLDVQVDPEEQITEVVKGNNSSRLGRLIRRENEAIAQHNVTAKQKLKDEMMTTLINRRDNRPHLLGVRIVSSSGDITGIDQLKSMLSTILVTRHEDLDLSVQLPTPFATLYEDLTGEEIVLKNSHIDYTVNLGRPKSMAGEPSASANPFKRMAKSVSILNPKSATDESSRLRGSKKKQSLFSQFGFSKRVVVEHKPIMQISELYSLFVTTPAPLIVTRVTRSTNRNSKKGKQPKRKLFSTPTELHLALRSLHEIGYILWYEDNEALRHIVFVDPRWVVNMIKTVIRHNMFEDGEGSLRTLSKPDSMTLEEFSAAKDLFREQATLDCRLLYSFDMWKGSSDVERFHMINLMRSFDLLCEQPRLADKDVIPKYFIPVYLKNAFVEKYNPENRQRMEGLEEEFINNTSAVPKFAKSLFTTYEGVTASQRILPRTSQQASSFFEDEVIRPKNIQWRYEFKHYFPEALFLRLLVRCHPYVQFDEQYKPTERFAVGRAALGVTIFIQSERNQYGLAGALILTAIQEQPVESASFAYNMRDIWQVFSLFAHELEDLLKTFPGLETRVYVNHVNSSVGKVIITRESLEVYDLEHNTDPKKQYRKIKVKLGATLIPMHYLIPPLYVLPKEQPIGISKKNVQYTEPELVRLSKIAQIEYGLLIIEAQAAEEVTGNRVRLQILHKPLINFVDKLLRFLCLAVNPADQMFVRGFESSLQFLRENNVEDVMALEPDIKKMRDFEQSAFVFANNYITKVQLDNAIKTCWSLFRILETKLIVKQNEPPKRPRKNLLF